MPRLDLHRPGTRAWWRFWLLWRGLVRVRGPWRYQHERGSPFPRPLKKGRYRSVNRMSEGVKKYRERMRPGIDM